MRLLAEMCATLDELIDHVSAPKRVVKNPNGEIVGVIAELAAELAKAKENVKRLTALIEMPVELPAELRPPRPAALRIA